MKKEIVVVALALFANLSFASHWTDYAEFEIDATNAIANISVLISDSYANRLHRCRSELDVAAIRPLRESVTSGNAGFFVE